MFTAAIKLEPETADHYIGRAQAYRLRGDRKLARADYQQARVLDPTLPEADEDLTNAEAIEAQRHTLQRAVRQAQKAFAAVGDAMLAQQKSQKQLAHSAAQLHRSFTGDERTPEQILAEVEHAEKDQLANATDYRDRGRALSKLNRLDEALTALNQAITLEDNDAVARDLRGQLYEIRLDYDHAIADYNRAVELSPKTAAYHRNRGDIWLRRKDFAQALADYGAAVTLDEKNPDNWYRYANTKYNLGRYADAIEAYDKVLKLNPAYPDAQQNRDTAQRRLATD